MPEEHRNNLHKTCIIESIKFYHILIKKRALYFTFLSYHRSLYQKLSITIEPMVAAFILIVFFHKLCISPICHCPSIITHQLSHPNYLLSLCTIDTLQKIIVWWPTRLIRILTYWIIFWSLVLLRLSYRLIFFLVIDTFIVESYLKITFTNIHDCYDEKKIIAVLIVNNNKAFFKIS